MIAPPFRYLAAESLSHAVDLLAAHEGSVVLAGGQSLVTALKLDLVGPSALVDVHRLTELRQVEAVEQGIRIGAAVTYAEMARHPLLRQLTPSLAAASGALVDRQVRNRGTLGGNCCLNDPTNNLPPLLASMNATFEVHQAGRPSSVLSADDFFLGTLWTAAAAPNLLVSVTVPAESPATSTSMRHQLVGADSWALARAAVTVRLDGGVVRSARVYLGAVPGSPLRLPAVEDALSGHRPGDVRETALAAFDTADVETVPDSHGSAGYRLAMARVQLGRALSDISTPPVAHQEVAA